MEAGRVGSLGWRFQTLYDSGADRRRDIWPRRGPRGTGMTDDMLEIEHRETPGHGEFTIGRLAILTYHKAGEGHIVVNHTRVAAEAQGQGLAGKLYKAMVRHARANRLQVSSTCSYVTRMFERFPEDRDVLRD